MLTTVVITSALAGLDRTLAKRLWHGPQSVTSLRPLLVEGSYLTVRRNTASAEFDGYRIKVRDLAGQGIVTDNRAIVRRYLPDPLVIEGARVNRRNEVVCTNPDPYQCTPESQN